MGSEVLLVLAGTPSACSELRSNQGCLGKTVDLGIKFDELLVMFPHKLLVGTNSLLPVARTCFQHVWAKHSVM